MLDLHSTFEAEQHTTLLRGMTNSLYLSARLSDFGTISGMDQRPIRVFHRRCIPKLMCQHLSTLCSYNDGLSWLRFSHIWRTDHNEGAGRNPIRALVLVHTTIPITDILMLK